MIVVELIVAGVLALLGIRSLVRWIGVEFRAASAREQAMYVLHVTARIGTWFALSGFFVAVALVDEPQSLDWYWYLLVGLPSIQLLTGFSLARSGTDATGTNAREATDEGTEAKRPTLAGRADD